MYASHIWEENVLMCSPEGGKGELPAVGWMLLSPGRQAGKEGVGGGGPKSGMGVSSNKRSKV